ncbi:helix-turn-helix protein [Actinomadura pelletieri DSM 43383]|uniref:Helix-turn-helix protein n=1 Tax=Actinomadura pelletieri DSM 43383 TaxID=1120940 RepID=A0A495QUB6_9ACTN|nr:helix-turn-helix transcriptional regulator [Actinomadura pelletieri]RKS77132.1 helix-turn-helix protein [Actinomadura pelletieri DSM 43383]
MVTEDDRTLLSSRRRLAGELRRLRDQAGLSGRQLAERIGISQSKVSRIESAITIPTAVEVASWGAAVGCSENVGAMLGVLADAAYTEVHPWSTALRDQGHLQDDIQEIEGRARTKRIYEPSLVPGLLQTAEYARRVFAMFDPPYLETDLPVVVTARLDRQAALFDPATRFEFLITEAALRWRVGPALVLLAQLDRIASLSTLENVSIGLIPHSAPARTHAPHGFVVLESIEAAPSGGHGDRDGPGDGDGDGFEADEAAALALVETVHANLTVGDPLQIALYQRQWARLEQAAVYGDDARDLLASIGADIRALAEDE